jgi:C-terminal processing protease CtpA/Prc
MTLADRKALLAKVDTLVRRKYFDPAFNGRDWPVLVAKHRESILSAEDNKDFEQRVNVLLGELGTSHTGFFNRYTGVPSRKSINATVRAADTPRGHRWVFQDIQPGGPADRAGIKPADILLSIDNRDVSPPQAPDFRMAALATVTVVHKNGAPQQVDFKVTTPAPKYPDCPYAEPQNVIAKRMDGGVGYLKVTMFPGIVGVDFANEVDRAVRELRDCDRLVVDVRGNPGGGIGGLRLMSYLTPDRLPVGYSLTRQRAERGYRREDLPQFRGIPDQKWQLPLVALRFVGRDQSIVVVTEGRGSQKFHGRIVVLTNEHTAGAAEMVAGFVRENRLATLVGRRTAGRLLGGSGFKLDHGYILMLPVGAYLTWGGRRFEGNGIEPDIQADWSLESAIAGADVQLQRAVEIVQTL